MKYKNYYKILGLKGPKSTDDEIKSAYRKLAKKYHPDTHPGDFEAGERFKDINEAYQVLSEKKSKKRYNIRYYFHIFDNGIDLNRLKNSEFVKIFIGEEVVVNTPKDVDNTTSKSNLDEEIHVQLSLEEAFLGVTKQISYKPFGEPQKKISIKIPRGSNNDTTILLKGEGRKANFGTENGDLHLNIELQDHKVFKLDKIDLIQKIKITPAEAAIGCEKSVKSIDDMAYKLVVPAGVQPGEMLKIKDAGFISKDGKRGDLEVIVNIGVPKELTAEEKKLYAKLKELSS